ncbi:MAG: SPOR domain-containing protein [Rhodobacteraceae bacterium]|nr:SPOR domain-containing protein [Paracoccaceae bacterium]
MSWQNGFWLAILASVALAGCEATAPGADGSAGAGGPGIFSKPKAVAEDVESPDVFSFSGEGLWDGRPSLGGIWVAHSAVTDPERVVIRNTKNGKSVVGALFRRERENPGPSLQVSSDAAGAIGLIAGQPTDMTVVALRKAETPVEDEAPAMPIATEEVAAAPSADASAQAAGLAGNAPPPNPKRPADAAADGAAAVASDAAAAEKPARKGLFGFLKKKPKPETDDTGDAPLSATAAPSGEIEQKPLDPVVAAASQGIANAEAQSQASDEAVDSAKEPVTAPTDATLRRAYIQIGTFSSEANAQFAVDQMKAEGMAATVKTGGSTAKPVWRVLVGPAASVAERDALIARIKQIGYKDAYPVRQ